MVQSAQSHTEIKKPEYVKQRLQEMGFWFVDIPRTSSTAIRLALYKRFGKVFGKPSSSQGIGIGLVPPHVPAELVKQQVGAELWDSLYRFSIVRNPFERVLSLFLFLQANGKFTQTRFSDYITKLVSEQGFDYHGHTMSNCGYLYDSNDQLLVDEVFRFEDRDQFMPKLADRIGCPGLLSNSTQTYRTDHQHYSNYYDAQSRKRIEAFFWDDFERFDYRFEDMR